MVNFSTIRGDVYIKLTPMLAKLAIANEYGITNKNAMLGGALV